MIRFRHKGDFFNTERFLQKAKSRVYLNALKKYGQVGVDALASLTPRDSGRTAASWSYEIIKRSNGYAICWNNSHVEDGVNIAVVLQYGHGTGTGGYVQGTDYINPAIRPIFDAIANEAWKEVIAK